MKYDRGQLIYTKSVVSVLRTSDGETFVKAVFEDGLSTSFSKRQNCFINLTEHFEAQDAKTLKGVT